MKKAFTLAEVLITVGIIGVVAAMTIPTLITAVESTRYKTNFKKTVSVLSQAAAMSKQNYGLDYGNATVSCGCKIPDQCLTRLPEQETSFCAIFNVSLKGIGTYGRIWNARGYSLKRIKTLNNWGSKWAITLPDGTLVSYPEINIGTNSTGSKYCTLAVGEKVTKEWIDSHPQCVGIIDTNGIGLPNQEVQCSEGETTTDVENPCVVKKRNDMSDIYPIVYHDSVVEPASNAAAYVFRN